MLIDAVSYGSLGSFSQIDNGLTNDASGIPIGVTHPFRFQVATNTPNDHVIPFQVVMKCKDGFNTNNPNDFVFTTNSFALTVQNGRDVPQLITSDFTLTPDHYWLARHPTLIQSNATLRIAPGTQVEFWGADPSNPLPPSFPFVFWQVEGSLLVEGTAEEPVELFNNPLKLTAAVEIRPEPHHTAICELHYARVNNGILGGLPYTYSNGNPSYYSSFPDPHYNNVPSTLNVIDHCEFTTDLWYVSPGPGAASAQVHHADALSNSLFHSIGTQIYKSELQLLPNHNQCLLDNCVIGLDQSAGYYTTAGNALLHCKGLAGGDSSQPGIFRDNAILNDWTTLDPSAWATFDANNRGSTLYLQGNYWGTTSSNLIRAAIYEVYDNFNKGLAIIDPILSNPPAACYPFVSDVRIRNAAGNIATVFGPERISFEVEFNRDMDTNQPLQVSFGPAAPYTDYTPQPANGWTNSRIWIGAFTVNPLTGDGYQ
jgi:hypothetical protein